MSPRMSKSCALVLLLAMSLGLAVGLLAWGPIVLTQHSIADPRLWAGMPRAFNALACLPLLTAGLAGVWLTRVGRLPAGLRAAWLGFFASAVLQAIGSAALDLAPGDWMRAMTQLFSAGAVTFLLLAFLAERIDAAFSGPRAMEIGVAISVIAASWWAAGQLLSHQGDLRALLLLQALPLLLVPSGAVNLAGRFTSSADWLWMLCLYGLAHAAGLADAALFNATGWVSGQPLMHLLSAVAVAWLAYRAGMAPGSLLARTADDDELTQRSTSLNTSS